MPNNKQTEEAAKSKTDEVKIDSVDNQPEAGEKTGQENIALKRQMQTMQGEMAKLSSVIAKLSQKTGVKLPPKAEFADAEAFIPALEDGRVIVDWRRKPGSAVFVNEKGQDVDMQFIIFTTDDGKEEEMSYQMFRQIRAMHKIPCKMKNFLKPNEFNQWEPVRKPKYDEMIEVVKGKMEGTEKVYNEEDTVKVKVYVLNP